MRNSRGQTTIEYFILMVVVIIVLMFFVTQNGFFQKSLNSTIVVNSNYMLNMANQIFN